MRAAKLYVLRLVAASPGKPRATTAWTTAKIAKKIAKKSSSGPWAETNVAEGPRVPNLRAAKW